jgi:hypothetical protein
MGLFQPTTLLLPVFPRACLADRWWASPPAPLALSQVEGLAPLALPLALCTRPVLKQSGAEGPALSGASGSAAYVTFELSSPQRAGSRLPRRSLAACPPWRGLRQETTPRTSSAQPERTLRADKNKSVRATREVGARKFALSNPNTRRLLWREIVRRRSAGPVRPLSGGRHSFTGTEKKPLTAISNRKSNDSRKLATISESTTSNFLIATKLHVSEEKAKSEEKANLLEASKTIVLGRSFCQSLTLHRETAGEVKGVFPFRPMPKFSCVQPLYAVDADKADSSRG